jgi:hypothetical protein
MNADERAQKIASELVYLALINAGKKTEFAFEFKGQKAIVRLDLSPRPNDPPDRLYISLDPPGEACKCCEGTGIQERAPPKAAAM